MTMSMWLTHVLQKVRLKSFLMMLFWPYTKNDRHAFYPSLAFDQNGHLDYLLVGNQRGHPHQMLMECKEHFLCGMYYSWPRSTRRWHGGQKTLTWSNQLQKKKAENSHNLWIWLERNIKSNWIQQWRIKGVYKDWNCCIFVKRITKAYEFKLVIKKDTVQFVFDLNTMSEDISNRSNST